MSSEKSPRERLIHHLLESGDEQQRLDFELAMLESDELFDQLSAAEVELIDSYVAGDVDAETAGRLAELVGRSPRLRETAETTLALSHREPIKRPVPDPSATKTSRGRSSQDPGPNRALPVGTVWAWLLGLTLLALGIVSAVELRRGLGELYRSLDRIQSSQERLEQRLDQLEIDMRRMQEDQLRLERQWAETSTREVGD